MGALKLHQNPYFSRSNKMTTKLSSTRSYPVHQQSLWRRTAAGLPCTTQPWTAQRRWHWGDLREPPAVLHSPRVSCRQDDGRDPLVTPFPSSIAVGKSIPVTLLSWLWMGDKKTPTLLTYLANVMLLILLRKQLLFLQKSHRFWGEEREELSTWQQ